MLALFLVMIAAVSCVDDLTPEGGWSGPVEQDDQLFIGNGDGRLVRFDPGSGNVDNSWRYPRGDDDGLGAMYSNSVVIGENIYNVGYTCKGDKCDGEIFGLNLADGSPIWGQNGLELKTKLVGSIGVSEDTIFVGTTAIGDEEDGAEGYFYALDSAADTSSITKWRIPLDANSFSGVAVEGSTAYIATMAGTLYAIDISDSDDATNPSERISWTYRAEGAIAGPILVKNRNLYFGDLASNVYKLDTTSRTTSMMLPNVDKGQVTTGEWKFDAGAWVWAAPVIEDGVVYVSALDGSIFALDEMTGSENWSSVIEGQIVSSPTLFDRKRGDTRERALAVPSGENNVWVISVIDGRELGVFITDEPVKSTPLIYNDNLYVHALNGHLKWFSVDDTTQRGCVDLKGGGRCD
ncbi:MAG: PQQ-binding-like beta-propeller repeat protein [Chloroflexi bacterium]|nr:PQQ-binding-like beta-propeller repeat protein [Chloroflexota bacterium]MDA1281410.1 PQQ-binding-like beta-propeller repeat protein [Chloroflexota bacterium]